jgi:hypothetical protein
LRTSAIIAVIFCWNFASEDASSVDVIFSARFSTHRDPSGSWKKKMTVGRRVLYFDGLWLPSSLMSVKTLSMTPVGFFCPRRQT